MPKHPLRIRTTTMGVRRRRSDLTEAVGLETWGEVLAGCRQLEVEVFEAGGEATCTAPCMVTFDFRGGGGSRGGGGHVSVDSSQLLAIGVGGLLPRSAHAQFRLHMFSAKRFQLFFRAEKRQRARLCGARTCVSVSMS